MLVCKRNRTVTKVTFVLPCDEPAGEVSVVGDFNDWSPGVHTFTRSTYGTRAVTLCLPLQQTYAFRYLAEGGHRFGEPDAPTSGANNIVTT